MEGRSGVVFLRLLSSAIVRNLIAAYRAIYGNRKWIRMCLIPDSGAINDHQTFASSSLIFKSPGSAGHFWARKADTASGRYSAFYDWNNFRQTFNCCSLITMKTQREWLIMATAPIHKDELKAMALRGVPTRDADEFSELNCTVQVQVRLRFLVSFIPFLSFSLSLSLSLSLIALQQKAQIDVSVL